MTRRRESRTDPAFAKAREAFGATAEAVADARAVLLLGVPSGRTARLPLAEALFGFEQRLAEAKAHLPGWRLPELEPTWEACAASLEEASARAERLRLEPTTDAYEDLVPALDGLLDPLTAFEEAAARVAQGAC